MDAGWSPAAVTSARILAAVMLLPVAAIRPDALRFRRRDLPLLLSYGLLGVAGVQLLFLVAVARVSVDGAMVLLDLASALVALWVRVVRHAQLPRAAWLGIGLAVAGLAVVAQVWQGTRLDLLGVAAGLGSAVCSAAYFLVGEHAAHRQDPRRHRRRTRRRPAMDATPADSRRPHDARGHTRPHLGRAPRPHRARHRPALPRRPASAARPAAGPR